MSLWMLVGVLVFLPCLAQASPPDPSWIQGLYDDKDFDDVVVMIISGDSVVEPFPAASVSPAPHLIARVDPAAECAVATGTPSCVGARGPPAFPNPA